MCLLLQRLKPLMRKSNHHRYDGGETNKQQFSKFFLLNLTSKGNALFPVAFFDMA